MPRDIDSHTWKTKVPTDVQKIICQLCDKPLGLIGTKFMTGLDKRVYAVCGSCYEDSRSDPMHTI